MKKKYVTAYSNCEKRKCFVPYSGNGMDVCRLYELGQCKGEYVETKSGLKKNVKTGDRRRRNIEGTYEP